MRFLYNPEYPNPGYVPTIRNTRPSRVELLEMLRMIRLRNRQLYSSTPKTLAHALGWKVDRVETVLARLSELGYLRVGRQGYDLTEAGREFCG